MLERLGERDRDKDCGMLWLGGLESEGDKTQTRGQ